MSGKSTKKTLQKLGFFKSTFVRTEVDSGNSSVAFNCRLKGQSCGEEDIFFLPSPKTTLSRAEGEKKRR